MAPSLYPHDSEWQPSFSMGYQADWPVEGAQLDHETSGFFDSLPGPFRWGRQLGGGKVPPLPGPDFSGIATVAAAVGVCVVGYFVYRHFAVAVGGTARGLKRSVSEGVT